MSEKIVVIYGKANTLSLPYATGEGKQRAIKFFKFVPGRNEMPKAVWDAINAELGEDRMANYSRHLKPLEAEVSEDGKIDFDSLKNAGELCDLIEETMTLEGLAEIRAYEESRDTQRKTVIASLEKQETEIEAFIKKVEKGEE